MDEDTLHEVTAASAAFAQWAQSASPATTPGERALPADSAAALPPSAWTTSSPARAGCRLSLLPQDFTPPSDLLLLPSQFGLHDSSPLLQQLQTQAPPAHTVPAPQPLLALSPVSVPAAESPTLAPSALCSPLAPAQHLSWTPPTQLPPTVWPQLDTQPPQASAPSPSPTLAAHATPAASQMPWPPACASPAPAEDAASWRERFEAMRAWQSSARQAISALQQEQEQLRHMMTLLLQSQPGLLGCAAAAPECTPALAALAWPGPGASHTGGKHRPQGWPTIPLPPLTPATAAAPLLVRVKSPGAGVGRTTERVRRTFPWGLD